MLGGGAQGGAPAAVARAVGPGGFGGSAGLTRLFSYDWAGQIAQLLPAAAILLVAGIVSNRVSRAPVGCVRG